MIESPTGVVTPSDDDNFAPTTDLGAMATSLDEIHKARSNHWIGTSAERVARRAEMAEGTFWSDTTGTKATWVKSGNSWSQVWPAPPARVLRLGSADETNVPFLNLRRKKASGQGYMAFTMQIASDEGQLVLFEDGAPAATLKVFATGRIGVLTGSGSGTTSAYRPLPLASARGKVTIVIPPGGGKTSTAITFPTGRFTGTPNIQLTLESGFPELASISANSLTKDGFTIVAHRTVGATIVVHWEATQT